MQTIAARSCIGYARRMNYTEDKSNTGTWITGIVAALVLYVLSWGPAVAYVHYSSDLRTNLQFRAGFHFFYAPVFWLAAGTPLGYALDPYLHWCCETFGRDDKEG